MNKIANRQVICETLMEQVKEDKSIVALCSDSRGYSIHDTIFQCLS